MAQSGSSVRSRVESILERRGDGASEGSEELSRDERTALHEAAHAVAYLAHGIPVVNVTVLPGIDSLGETTVSPLSEQAGPEEVESRVIGVLAGPAMDDLIGTQTAPSSRDFSLPCLLVGRLPGTRSQRGQLVKQLRQRAHKLVANPSNLDVVCGLAQELLKNPTMSGESVNDWLTKNGYVCSTSGHFVHTARSPA